MPEYLKAMSTPQIAQAARRWRNALAWYEANRQLPGGYAFSIGQLSRVIPLADAILRARALRAGRSEA